MKRIWWANILCKGTLDHPFKVIVTDGLWTDEIPVQNTKLKTIKHYMQSVYGVKPSNILVSVIKD